VEGQPDEEKLKNWSGRGTGATTARKGGGDYKEGIQEQLQGGGGGGVLQGRDTAVKTETDGEGGSLSGKRYMTTTGNVYSVVIQGYHRE
jgi:hypothetical protein